MIATLMNNTYLFNMYQILHEKYYNTENYLLQTRSQARFGGIPPSKLSQKIPGETKIETRRTNHVNSTDPMHSINNVDKGMTHTRPLITDVAFHPVQLKGLLPNPLYPTCQEVRKVHKVHLVQKI